MLKKQLIAGLAGAALIAAPMAGNAALAAKSSGPKYAKSEIEKANTACVITILLAGGIGAAIGKGKGALVGASAGLVVCAILQMNARNKEKIIAAQAETAGSKKGLYNSTFQDDQGDAVTYSGTRTDSVTVDSAQMVPVRYSNNAGEQVASELPETGSHECRTVSSSLNYSSGASGNLPGQVYCRTSSGDWEPYQVKKS